MSTDPESVAPEKQTHTEIHTCLSAEASGTARVRMERVGVGVGGGVGGGG